MTCYERLLAFERANEDAEVTAALARAAEIRGRLEQAREALVLAHLGIVPYFIKDYVRGVIPFVDLIQEGYLGLLNAVDRFDPERGKFSTYAYWWIRKAMSNAFTFQVRTIRLPASVLEELRRKRTVSRELEARLGRQPTEREVAQRMKISVKKLRKLASLAVDASALEDLDTTRSEGWSAILPESSIPDPQESTLGRELREQTEEALQLLSPRERTIIRARFGFEDGEGMTRDRIGRNLGLSSERVRQIERRALEKIYRWAKRNGFKPTRRQNS
jgi:RNA polymerase sigma factor (sigma-70 family)